MTYEEFGKTVDLCRALLKDVGKLKCLSVRLFVIDILNYMAVVHSSPFCTGSFPMYVCFGQPLRITQ